MRMRLQREETNKIESMKILCLLAIILILFLNILWLLYP